MKVTRGMHSGGIGRIGRIALVGLVAVGMSLAWTSSVSAMKPPPNRIKDKLKKGPGITNAQRGARLGQKTAFPKIVPLDPNAPRSRAVVDAKTHDFGTVWIGPALHHTFKIKNEGNAPLEIKRVKPSCGCMIAGAYPKTIAPGETGEFPFSVKSTRLRGKFIKSIAINTNDPDNVSMRIQLKGEVKQYVEVVPPNVYFGKMRADEPTERVLKISNNTDKPLELAVGKKMKGNYDVEIITKEPGQLFELHVTAKPPYPEGPFREWLKLTTNIEEQKEIKIDVRGTVPQRLEVTPKTLLLSRLGRRVAADKPIMRIVRLTNYGRRPVKLREAKVDDPEITTTINELVEGKAYTVELKFPVGYKLPTLGRKLTLVTDDRSQSRLVVPILNYKQDKAVLRPAEQLVGTPTPKVDVVTTAGEPLTNESMKGNVTVLDFFAPNCGFCKKQIPRLDKVREKYAEKGVRFIAVSQTMRNKKYTDQQVQQLMDQLGFKGELVLDPGNTLGPRFKATSYPTMVVIGKDAKIAAVNLGNIGDLEKRLAGQLDALLGIKPSKGDAVAQKPATPPAPKPAKKKRADDLIGKPAPKFTMTSLDGKTVSSDDFSKNSATVLNFVAVNCGYCGKQIPRLEAMRKKYESKGVRFVNMVQTMRKKYTEKDVVAKMKKFGSNLEVVHDVDNKVGPDYGASGFPTMVVVGKSGNIEAVNVGNIGDLEKRLATQLDAIIAGKPVPKIAAAPRPQRKRPADLLGKPAPKFTMTNFDGKTVSSDDFGKHPATVLNFVAVNCGYCGKQIPRLEAMRKKYESQGVRFVNIVETMRKKFTKEEVVAKMTKLGSKLEVVHDLDNKIGPGYGAGGFPTMVVVGKSGNIEALNVGNIADLEKRLATQLDALIAGKPVPKIAAAPRPQRKRPADLIGKPAPKFTMTNFDGKTVSSDDFGKHPATVLNFVAVNCGYCGKQIPRLEAMRKKYESKGVRFVNMVQTMRNKKFTKEDVVAKMKKFGSNLEVVHDVDNKVGPGYGARGFPTMVVVGKSGNIEAVNVGNIADLEKRLTGQLDALIAGKALPKVATAKPKARRRPAEDTVGKPAPAFTVTTMDGKSISNATFKDHPATVLNFVAPNCGFCKRALPNVEKVRKEYESKGIRFVNIVQKMRKEYTTEEIVDVLKGTGSRLAISTSDFKDNVVGKAFKAVSYPTMVVVDRTGKVAHVNIGAKQNLESLLKGQLDALLK